MADNFLGSKIVPIEQTPFAGETPVDWASRYIVAYGGFDGEHHKTWVLDQVFRILHGTPMIVESATWGPSKDYPNGHHEWRYYTGEPSAEYLKAVADAKYDDATDDPEGYSWDEGIAP